jgi:hypothetical protein
MCCGDLTRFARLALSSHLPRASLSRIEHRHESGNKDDTDRADLTDLAKMQHPLLQGRHELINLESKTLESKLSPVLFIASSPEIPRMRALFLLVIDTPLSSSSSVKDPCVDGSLAARL